MRRVIFLKKRGLRQATTEGDFTTSVMIAGTGSSVWKTSKTDMVTRVLKNTRSYAGKEVAMRLRDNTYIIEPVAT